MLKILRAGMLTSVQDLGRDGYRQLGVSQSGAFDAPALRIGNLADSSLVARRLGELKRVICCSPAYLQRMGTPETPDDLLHHHCLRYGREGQTGWELEHNGRRRLFDVRGPIVSNNGEVLRDAAVAGLGLVLLPEFIVGPALQYGALVRVLDAFHPGSLSLHAIYPQHRQRSEVTRVFLDFLQERLKAQLLVSAPENTPRPE